MWRHYLSSFILVFALLPTTTLAEASITTQSPGQCDQISTALLSQERTVAATADTQATALTSAHQRLRGLIDQAGVQGKTLNTLASLDNELVQRTTTLRQAYATFSAALQVAANQCGETNSKAAARIDLAAIRTQVTSLKAWNTATLAPAIAAAGKAN